MKHQAQRNQQTEVEGGVGANDANSGGGAGAGVPDADTGMRAEDIVTKGDVKQDSRRIFPGRDETTAGHTKDQDAPKGI